MSYLEQVNQKRQTLSEKQQTAMLMRAASSQKPSIILTDSSDLGEHIAELGDKIIEVMNAVKADKSTKEQIDRLASDLKNLTYIAHRNGQEQTDKLITAVNELKDTISKQKPVVVPAPAVNLAERELDLSPLLKKLDQLVPKATKKSVDLSTYRAHDLADERDGMQYIGFQDLEGNWYIMQHDPKTNRARYYFGKEGYEQAWDDKHTHDYKTLSEAKRAIRS